MDYQLWGSRGHGGQGPYQNFAAAPLPARLAGSFLNFACDAGPSIRRHPLLQFFRTADAHWLCQSETVNRKLGFKGRIKPEYLQVIEMPPPLMLCNFLRLEEYHVDGFFSLIWSRQYQSHWRWSWPTRRLLLAIAVLQLAVTILAMTGIVAVMPLSPATLSIT